ncbi:hypothetical protein [Flavonifractor plautii]|jgi:hypothetical protein|uniref:hypothetical protein n=1 Tax=Flavonifractor plautii TaxID=292800 RepID=UPI0011074D09|nr:hypothetical protein [Flavonifractor plautii]DAO10421.1 MAG TPA: hypothetical protein [Caudoviricetes sp.]
MYEIRKDGALLALTEQVNYIRLHPDGFYLLCPEAEAQGVAVAGTPYHLMGRDEMPECETVLVQETDAGRVLREEQAKAAAEARLTSQMQAAVKLYVKKATDIPDEQALEMPDLFRTWDEVLAAGEQLEADTVLNLDGQLYGVVQPVTPQEHQRPDGEGMLAIYRPIDQTHEGTREDPVPFVYGMDTEQGTYYSSGGKTYLCNLTMTPCVWAPGTPGLWQWTEVTE